MRTQNYNFQHYQDSPAPFRFHVQPYKASVLAALTDIINDGPVTLQVTRSGDGFGSLTAFGKSGLAWLASSPKVEVE